MGFFWPSVWLPGSDLGWSSGSGLDLEGSSPSQRLDQGHVWSTSQTDAFSSSFPIWLVEKPRQRGSAELRRKLRGSMENAKKTLKKVVTVIAVAQ